MWPVLINQIIRPFASLLFYRNYIKNDVADDFQKAHPNLDRDEAMHLAEQEIRHNRVPALDPLGAFRDPYELLKEDPRTFWQKLKAFLWKCFWVYVVFMVLLTLVTFWALSGEGG